MSLTGPVLPAWSIAAPAAGAALLAGAAATVGLSFGGTLSAFTAPLLLGAVLAAVHHAEVIALRVGEPYGTLILALAVTALEAGLIVTLMLADPQGSATLARDSVFAAAMLILTGVTGLCLLVGAARHHVQRFGLYGVNAALSTLAVMAVVVFILPNFTVTTLGPTYSAPQLALVALVCLILYAAFVLVQTVRHRAYFLSADVPQPQAHAEPPTARQTMTAAAILLFSLGVVVLLAKAMSATIEAAVDALDAPKATVGVVIAFMVLLPESLSAVRNARANRLQTSLNLALGSALATIGLTIPVIAVISLLTGLPLVLGLDAKNMVLLALALLIATQSLATGRTTVMQGAVHLVLFALFLFLTVVP